MRRRWTKETLSLGRTRVSRDAYRPLHGASNCLYPISDCRAYVSWQSKRRGAILMFRCFGATAAAVGVAILWAPSPSLMGADYPSRPIRMIVGFAAGGGADTAARIIATRLSDR